MIQPSDRDINTENNLENFETLAALYLLTLPPSELNRASDFFSELNGAGVHLPDSIRLYLDTRQQEELWLRNTLAEFLEHSVAELPEAQATTWLYEKLLTQRQRLNDGILLLEHERLTEEESLLPHFLIALLMAQQPFSRWPVADRYLLNLQEQSAEQKKTFYFYRRLLQAQFAALAEPLTTQSSRNFLTLKLFASAGEMPNLQAEVDQLLATLSAIDVRQNDWQERLQSATEQEKSTIAECQQKIERSGVLKQQCQTKLEANDKKVTACHQEWNQVHKPRHEECNKRREQINKINIDMTPCTASSEACIIAQQEALNRHSANIAKAEQQLAQCKAWEKETDAWRARCRPILNQAKTDSAQCDQQQAESAELLKQCGHELDHWSQQRKH